MTYQICVDPLTPEDTLIYLRTDSSAGWRWGADLSTIDSAAYASERSDMRRNAVLSRDLADQGKSHRDWVRGIVNAVDAVPGLGDDVDVVY